MEINTHFTVFNSLLRIITANARNEIVAKMSGIKIDTLYENPVVRVTKTTETRKIMFLLSPEKKIPEIKCNNQQVIKACTKTTNHKDSERLICLRKSP
jgi:hypothetical protein